MAPQVGLEPTTLRLTAGCSAIELLRSVRPAKELACRKQHHIKALSHAKVAVTLPLGSEPPLPFSQPLDEILTAVSRGVSLAQKRCTLSTSEGLTSLQRHAINARFVLKAVPGPVSPSLARLWLRTESDAAKLSTPISCLAVEACSELRYALTRRPLRTFGGIPHAGKRHLNTF